MFLAGDARFQLSCHQRQGFSNFVTAVVHPPRLQDLLRACALHYSLTTCAKVLAVGLDSGQGSLLRFTANWPGSFGRPSLMHELEVQGQHGKVGPAADSGLSSDSLLLLPLLVPREFSLILYCKKGESEGGRSPRCVPARVLRRACRISK